MNPLPPAPLRAGRMGLPYERPKQFISEPGQPRASTQGCPYKEPSLRKRPERLGMDRKDKHGLRGCPSDMGD